MKVAFLDRDGTIVKDYPDDAWNGRVEPEFLPRAIEGMKLLREKGYEIVILTNQYLIGEGRYSLEDYKLYTAHMQQILSESGVGALDIKFCPHSRHDHCECMKPHPGMIDDVLSMYHDIEIEKSILVGDAASDIELGRHFGIHTFGINTESDYENHKMVTSLYDAANTV